MISVIIPSLHPNSLARALDNLAQVTTADYEAVVISPFPPQGARVRWVKEEAPLGGPCAAQAYAGQYATGDYVLALSDDRILFPGWDQVVLKDFDRAPKNRPFGLGLRHKDPAFVGTVFGINYPNFPMMRRSDVLSLGWYDPIFRASWGDVDLGLRIWDAGGRCEWSSEPVMSVHPDDEINGRRVDWSDMHRFIERWGKKYGKGWRTEWIGDFNLDVYPEMVPQLVEDNTIYFNDPSFVDLVKHAANPRQKPVRKSRRFKLRRLLKIFKG
jgi:hypothetical protein